MKLQIENYKEDLLKQGNQYWGMRANLWARDRTQEYLKTQRGEEIYDVNANRVCWQVSTFRLLKRIKERWN